MEIKGNINAGYGNSITGGTKSSIVGGEGNSNSATQSFIGGGLNNTINTSSSYSSINGGQNNIVNHTNAHIIGSNITSVAANTTHVEGLNINTVETGTSVSLLAIDASGKVIVGEASSSILYTNIPSIEACASPATASITTSLLSKDDDTLHIKYRTTGKSTGGGGSRLVVSGGTTQIAFTHPYDGVTSTNGMVEVHMVKSGTTLVGNAVFVGTPDVYKTYDINVTNFFDGSVTDLIIESTSACEDSENNNVIIQLLKSQ